MRDAQPRLGIVIIGRNEGERLVACLRSVGAVPARIVYVDSGSTDGSVAEARRAGAVVVSLDTRVAFTAARARNAGFQRLLEDGPCDAVQFIDGDCALREGWLDFASNYLAANPKVAVVCGRRRERFPDATIYNWLIDREWNTPVGQAKACGGDAMMRAGALAEVGGFNPNLIAGEEPELCVRLRQSGWEVWRLDHEMTWHDAAITRFGQWWKRARRAGHAAAEGAALHGQPPERHGVAQTRRALAWGLVLPALVIIGALITPWALLLALLWPLKMARLILRGHPWQEAIAFTLGNVAEAIGALEFHWRKLTNGRIALIEYK